MSSLWPVPTYDAVRQLTKAQAVRQQQRGRDRPDGRHAVLRQRVAAQAGGVHLGARRLRPPRPRGSTWTSGSGRNLSLSLRTFYSRGYTDGSSACGGNMFFRLTRQPASVNLLARDTIGRLYARSNIMNGGDQNNNPLMYTTWNGVIDNSDRRPLRRRRHPALADHAVGGLRVQLLLRQPVELLQLPGAEGLPDPEHQLGGERPGLLLHGCERRGFVQRQLQPHAAAQPAARPRGAVDVPLPLRAPGWALPQHVGLSVEGGRHRRGRQRHGEPEHRVELQLPAPHRDVRRRSTSTTSRS